MSNSRGKYSNNCESAQGGFSLLELMLVVVILTVIVAIVVRGAVQLQRKSSTETAKVDLTQEARQFMDQVVKDLHHAGFPNVRMFDAATSTANPNSHAVGLVSVASNAIQFEGDVDGSGTVSQVFVQLNPPAGPCPCTLRRGTLPKGTPGAPLYFTEVDNVMNTNIFTAYLIDGTSVTLPASASDLLNIKTIGLTVNLRSTSLDQTDRSYSNITMATEAKINN
jgi:prepilin-type N-terminal cleavage/methylation domain-containing protein